MANCNEIKSRLLKIVSELEKYEDGKKIDISAYDNMGGYNYLDLDDFKFHEGMDGILYMTIG